MRICSSCPKPLTGQQRRHCSEHCRNVARRASTGDRDFLKNPEFVEWLKWYVGEQRFLAAKQHQGFARRVRDWEELGAAADFYKAANYLQELLNIYEFEIPGDLFIGHPLVPA